jgi:hypothetical protein
MSPLPPGSVASTICGKRSRRMRRASAWLEKVLGMLCGMPMTKGTAPSHTSGAASNPAMVFIDPPLPP